MGDVEGTFRITYHNVDNNMKDITLDFGSITNITASVTKATSTIPLVSMGVDRAFQLENGGTLQYIVGFKRKHPTDFDNTSEDTTKWSNRYWYLQIDRLINRWQMKTNGCRMTYKPDETNPYVPVIDYNGYIKNISRKYTNRFNELIDGTITFVVGTTHVLSPKTTDLIPSNTTSYEYVTLHNSLDSTKREKYGIKDVLIQINTSRVIAPDMPSEWILYSKYGDKSFKGWKKFASDVYDVDDVFKPGARISLGSLRELWAVWE